MFSPFGKNQRSFNESHVLWVGRRGDPIFQWDGETPLLAQWMRDPDAPSEEHCDKGGEYWGRDDVYAVYTEDGVFCVYVNSVESCEQAIDYVASMQQFRFLDFAPA